MKSVSRLHSQPTRHHAGLFSRPAARRFVQVIRLAEICTAVLAAAVLVAVLVPAGSTPAAQAGPEKPDLTVAVVPAADSAGFFVALHDGLFKREGLTVHFEPAVSSETVIDQQSLSTPSSPSALDVTCGNYISYVEAQEAWERGQRPSPSRPGVVAANLDIVAEGSVMQAATQGLYTMPGSPVRSLADLHGKIIGINAPLGILYLLIASVLAQHALPVSSVHFAYVPLPLMAGALAAGTVQAAELPEPFAAQAEQRYGVRTLADLDQGAATAFPVQGCVVTKRWAAEYPRTLAAFYRAFEQGQEIADTSRTAVERAMEALPTPLSVSRGTAALMALDSYPVSGGEPGTVDLARLARVVDVMRQFLGFPAFAIQTMLISA